MTRGTIIYVGNGKVLESTEFNGDMYPEGCGDGAMEMLRKVDGEDAFRKMVRDFNEKNHQYDEELIYEKKNFFDEENKVDFNNRYFERFFSDWIFVVNCSDKPISFICEKGEIQEVVLPVGKATRFNFGMAYEG